MKKTIGTLALGLLCAIGTNAQNETDALRYSFLNNGGTARYNGMGGAFGALGGDMTTLSINPAGIGVYRKSEFSFTTAFAAIDADATYNGTTVGQSEANLNIGNIGIVSSYDLDSKYGWRNFQFGLSYNRINNFHGDYLITGEEAESTLLDVFAAEAAGWHPDDVTDGLPFTSGLAYQTWAIDPADTLGANYLTQIPFGGVKQSKSITTSGRMGETLITFGGNWDDRIYVGGSFGFPSINYSENAQYEEEVLADSTLSLQSFKYNTSLTTRGMGFNAKFGMIFSPHPFVRIGASIASPSWFSLTDTWNAGMETSFKPNTGYASSYDTTSVDGRFDYRLTTPARATGSLAFIIGKKGIISADYEYVDYSTAKLRPDGGSGVAYNFQDENAQIQQQYMEASNIRIGTEWRLNPFSIRAGYQLSASPYNTNVTVTDGTRTTYSVGLGYRERGYFLDIAYSLTNYESDYYLYDPALVNAATLDNSFSRVSVTLGFRY